MSKLFKKVLYLGGIYNLSMEHLYLDGFHYYASTNILNEHLLIDGDSIEKLQYTSEKTMSIQFSCSLTFRNQYFIFGGEAKLKFFSDTGIGGPSETAGGQVIQVNGRTLERISTLRTSSSFLTQWCYSQMLIIRTFLCRIFLIVKSIISQMAFH